NQKHDEKRNDTPGTFAPSSVESILSGRVRQENGCGPTSGTATWYIPPGTGSSSVTEATPTRRPSDDSGGRSSHCCCSGCSCPPRKTWTCWAVNGSDPGCEYQIRQPLPPSSGLPGTTHVSTCPLGTRGLMLSAAGAPRKESRASLPDYLAAGRRRKNLACSGFHTVAGGGREGGSRNAGGLLRSSASRGSDAAASRSVSGGRFHFLSTSLRIEMWSYTYRNDSGRPAW